MKYKILGARGKIGDIDVVINGLKELGERYDIIIQLLDARYVFGMDHLRSAVDHAERAFENHTNLAKSIAVEIMLYSSGERQISQAIEKMGVKDDTSEFGLILYDLPEFEPANELENFCVNILSELGLEQDDSVLKGDRSVLERFGISSHELDSVEELHWCNLVLERVAMVDIIK